MILTILDSTGTTQGPNERRRYLQIGLLALALLLVAVLGFRQVQRWMTPQREVWVASADLPVGSTLGAANLKKVKLAEGSLPKGAILDARALAGRELARAKQEGSPFVREDFSTNVEKMVPAAEMVPEGRVLTTIRVPKGLVPYKNLKNGDHVDLVGVGGIAHVVARDAYLIGMIFSQQPAEAKAPRTGLAALIPPPQTGGRADPTVGLVLAIHPEDALPLSQAMAARRGRLQVVLHGQTEVASGQLLEIPEKAPVEFIAGSKKTQLVVTP